MSKFRVTSSTLLAVFFLAGALEAQPDSTVASILSDVRQGRAYGAAAVLRGADLGGRRRDVEALADSLSAIARGADTSAAQARAAASAVAALGFAGREEGEGTPYAGSARRLFEIATAVAGNVRGGAIYGLSELANRREALDYLARAGELDSPSSISALNLIVTRFGADGEQELRRMYERNSARHARAKEWLDDHAVRRGWRRNEP